MRGSENSVFGFVGLWSEEVETDDKSLRLLWSGLDCQDLQDCLFVR